MRIKDGFVLREVAGKTMVIATGEASRQFHGMITLNESGRMIWEGVTEGKSVEDIAEGLAEKYAIPKEEALEDTAALVKQMEQAGFLVS